MPEQDAGAQKEETPAHGDDKHDDEACAPPSPEGGMVENYEPAGEPEEEEDLEEAEHRIGDLMRAMDHLVVETVVVSQPPRTTPSSKR